MGMSRVARAGRDQNLPMTSIQGVVGVTRTRSVTLLVRIVSAVVIGIDAATDHAHARGIQVSTGLSTTGGRRKSKSDRRKEDDYRDGDRERDKEKGRRSSRRDHDYEYESKDRSHASSKHGRSSRDERHREHDRSRESERENQRPVLEEPQDEIGFKIKGTKSAAMQAGVDTSMAPPTTSSRDRSHRRASMQESAPPTPSTPAADPYAEEREKRQRERLDRENSLRRQSTQSLGKRMSRCREMKMSSMLRLGREAIRTVG